MSIDINFLKTFILLIYLTRMFNYAIKQNIAFYGESVKANSPQ